MSPNVSKCPGQKSRVDGARHRLPRITRYYPFGIFRFRAGRGRAGSCAAARAGDGKGWAGASPSNLDDRGSRHTSRFLAAAHVSIYDARFASFRAVRADETIVLARRHSVVAGGLSLTRATHSQG